MLIAKQSVHIVTGVVVSVGLFVFMVCMLALYTLQDVGQSEFAVEYDTYNIQFGKVLSQGKYSVGVGTELIKFQRTLQDLKLGELSCLTKDQIVVTLDVTVQIQYNADALVPIILEQFGTNSKFRVFLEGMARSSVFNSCSHFDANTYFTNRAAVDIAMTESISEVINPSTVGTTVVFFQLINIAFPDAYNSVLLSKQTTEQLETTLDNDRLNQITIAETNLFVANNTANIKIIQAEQQAATIINQADTSRAAIASFWTSRAESYGAVMWNFNYTNTTELIDYINSEILRKNPKLVAGVK